MKNRRTPATLSGHYIQIVAVALLVLAVDFGWAAEPIPSLLSPSTAATSAPAYSSSAKPAWVARSRSVTVNLGIIKADKATARVPRLGIELFDRVQITALFERADLRSAENYTWYGAVEGYPLSQVILTVVDGAVAGHIFFLDPDRGVQRQYEIRFSATGSGELIEIDQIKFPPDHPPNYSPPVVLERENTPPTRPAVAENDTGLVIDVMVVYSNQTAAAAGASIGAQIQAAIDAANNAYANSGVASRLRLVHNQQVAYDESGDFSVDITRLAGTADGYIDNVHTLRNTYGADLVSMFVESASVCGTGYLQATSSSAFTVVNRGCATANHSLAHEIGHNMGANHDTYVAPSSAPFPYGHGYVNLAGRIRTVMAYNNQCQANGFNCTRLGLFSTPILSYNGYAIGTPDAGASNSADVVRVHNGTAYTVANFRQSIPVAAMPGTATVSNNTYGALTVSGGTVSGNTISNLQPGAIIQLGNVAGSANSYIKFDFQGMNIGAGNSLLVRPGAPNQAVVFYNADATVGTISGGIQMQAWNGVPAPTLYLHNPNGINVGQSGFVTSPSGLTVDTLSAGSFTVGQPITNNGSLVGGSRLDIFSARVTGSGAFTANNVFIATFGNANNPINGYHYLDNGLNIFPGSGNNVSLVLNAYGALPQVLNAKVNGNALVWMPSAWPSGATVPRNNLPIAFGGSRAAGVPDPAYGGGSMIVQATGNLSLYNGGTNDFAFPGGIVLKAVGTLDMAGVVVNQGWTTTGRSFQGVFLESPNIISTGNIQVLSNNLNWINFSSFPKAPVRAYTLVRNATTGNAAFAAADAIAPHLNTYSLLIETAAAGQCYVCLVNTAPVNMY